MCTAVSYTAKDHYFGRNLDLDDTYGEQVVMMPRDFSLGFRNGKRINRHYSVIGIAHIADGIPLFYDAVNEKGIAMAGLNFPGSAVYHEPVEQKNNLCPFEVLLWLLGRCATLEEAKHELQSMNIIDQHFSTQLPNTPLHWMISSSEGALVVESIHNGLCVHENPAGVLTNNPPFECQMLLLNQYMGLSAQNPENCFSSELPLHAYSLGMGAVGLPGDYSSMSRFVRASFVRAKSRCAESEEEAVSQFFHILGSVEQVRGCNHVREGRYEITRYSSCCNLEKGIYYYRTYENSMISAIHMHHEVLDGTKLIQYPLSDRLQIHHCN